MLAHIAAHTGIKHTPYPKMPPRLGKPATWKVVEWKRWSLVTGHRHGKVPKARMAP